MDQSWLIRPFIMELDDYRVAVYHISWNLECMMGFLEAILTVVILSPVNLVVHGNDLKRKYDVDAKMSSIVDDQLNIHHMSKKSNDITIESREKIDFLE